MRMVVGLPPLLAARSFSARTFLAYLPPHLLDHVPRDNQHDSISWPILNCIHSFEQSDHKLIAAWTITSEA